MAKPSMCSLARANAPAKIGTKVYHTEYGMPVFAKLCQKSVTIATFWPMAKIRSDWSWPPILCTISENLWLVWQGYKEVTLLGQNVNSYRDTSVLSFAAATPATPTPFSSSSGLSAGFQTVYRARHGGRRFADLLSQVADVNPQMRIRFTSPHPKDFPDDVNTPLHSATVTACLHCHWVLWNVAKSKLINVVGPDIISHQDSPLRLHITYSWVIHIHKSSCWRLDPKTNSNCLKH